MSRDRRTFLRALGVGAAGALAGCPGSSDGSTPTDGDEPSPAPTTKAGDGTSTPTPGGGGTPTSTPPPQASGGPTIITLEGAGTDIWNKSDFGFMYYETLSGDFDVSVEVMSVQNTHSYAKAGLMVRAGLPGGSRNVFARKRPGDLPVSPQWRPTDGAESASVTSDAGRDLARNGGAVEGDWQRIVREGDTIRVYGSADGEEWTLLVELGPETVDLPNDVVAGLAVTSHDRAELCEARFRNLEGVSPQYTVNLGGALVEGDVSVTENVPVAETGDVTDASASGASLTAEVSNLGDVDSADLAFEYREVPASEWSDAGTTTVSEAGTASVEVDGLTARRYYEFRVTIDNGDVSVASPTGLFSTPGLGSGGDEAGPRSSSAIDPSDGFGEMAPWLDDDTPLVVIDEPEAAQLDAAFGVNGPRVVVFETSGTVDLDESHVSIDYDQCWVAGQTAPSPGITLIRGGLLVNADDCVVQHVRARPGDAGVDGEWQNDPFRTADGSANNVIDHCTATWSTDENLSIGYETTDSTMTNCLVAEPLHDSIHPKGPHGYNSLIGNDSKNVTLAGNVWALVTDRNPRLKQGTETAVVNNLIHHHQDGMWADPDTEHSVVGNAFEDPQTNQANVFGEGTVYAEDNAQLDGADVPMIGDSVSQVDSRPLFPEGLSPMSSSEVKQHNLENAGARPADRTEHDERIVENVRNGEGDVIDSQEEVGGYPDLDENTEELGVPDTGLRAWLREQALAVEP